MIRPRAIFFALAFAGAACATVAGIDELSVGDCKGGICGAETGTEEEGGIDEPETGTDAPIIIDGAPCPSGKGPTSIRVGTTANSFCIDTTEVTNAQYRQFLDAGQDVKVQPPECTWNTSFAATFDGGLDGPVVGVDWCDALAYCKWAGKYLCGKVQGSKKVGPVSDSERNDPQTSQWFIACSQAGALRYPYGGVHRPTACNTGERDAGKPLPVGSATECNGGYPGVFDMIGNVWEWYDGPCRRDGGLQGDGGDAGPPSDECYLRGGSYLQGGQAVDCLVNGVKSRRDAKEPYLGFRCCAD
jgi:formylglycine-generating enzyme